MILSRSITSFRITMSMVSELTMLYTRIGSLPSFWRAAVSSTAKSVNWAFPDRRAATPSLPLSISTYSQSRPFFSKKPSDLAMNGTARSMTLKPACFTLTGAWASDTDAPVRLPNSAATAASTFHVLIG